MFMYKIKPRILYEYKNSGIYRLKIYGLSFTIYSLSRTLVQNTIQGIYACDEMQCLFTAHTKYKTRIREFTRYDGNKRQLGNVDI
jgi:hypothetical protein